MSNTQVVLPAEALDIRVSGRLMTDFPATGTYMSIEKVTPRSTVVEGRNGTGTFVRNNSTMYRVTLNLMQGHPDDKFMGAAIKALQFSTNVLTFSFKVGSTAYISNAMDIETEPTRELAADNSPMMVYVLGGFFPAVAVGDYFQPTQLTEDAILAFEP